LERIREVLTKIGVPAVPHLVRLCKNGSDQVRAAAFYFLAALAAIDPDAVAPPLLALLRDRDPWVHRRAYSILCTLRVQTPMLKTLLPAILEAFERDEELSWPFVDWSAKVLFQFAPEAPETIPALVDAVSLTGAFDLRLLGPGAVPWLIESLKGSRFGKARSLAATLLSEMRADAKSVVPPLIEALADKDEHVVLSACESLLVLRNESAQAGPAFIEAFRHREETIGLPAGCSLPDVGNQAFPATIVLTLFALWKSYDADVSRRAARALCAFEIPLTVAKSLLPAILELLKQEDQYLSKYEDSPEVALWIDKVLIQLVLELPGLIPALLDAVSLARDFAEYELEELGPGAIPWLVASLKVCRQPRARRIAAELLGKFGIDANTVVPALMEAIRRGFQGHLTTRKSSA
jgi:HEAT repeat protein